MQGKDSVNRKRVVVTGMGALSPLGNTLETSWQAAIEGRSGIARVTLCDVADLPCQIAGEVKGFDPLHYLERKEARRMGRSSQLAVAAWSMARVSADLPTTLPNPERSAVLLGTAMGGYDRLTHSLDEYEKGGWSQVNPFALTSSLPNMPSYYVGVSAGALGMLGTQVAACASGVQAIGEAMAWIRRGSADLVITGGVEAIIQPGPLAGFCAMRAMPTAYNDNPSEASRPFDLARSGFVLSEAAAILVLESLEHAMARGAPIYGEVLGYASSADAYHAIQPDPTAQGAVRVMRWALEDAQIAPSSVDYINAHGTGTPINDKGETAAIKAVLGDHAYRVAISSTKSVMGHAMGGAGAIETIFSLCALQYGVIPPTINYTTPDPDCDLDYVPNIARPASLKIAMKNAFGLGGQNASLILQKYEEFG